MRELHTYLGSGLTRERASAMLDLQKPGQACIQDEFPATSLIFLRTIGDCGCYISPLSILIHCCS